MRTPSFRIYAPFIDGDCPTKYSVDRVCDFGHFRLEMALPHMPSWPNNEGNPSERERVVRTSMHSEFQRNTAVAKEATP